ncbi:winged helix-turn-helix domain-containing protein [Thermoflexus hugenholtzii]
MVHQGQPVSMDRLLRWVWGCRGDEKDLLKRLVYRLRRKLEPDPKVPRFIRTVPGVGYTFGPAERGSPGPRAEKIGTNLGPG